MPYKLNWYIPERVIYGYIWGEQVIGEIQEANVKFSSMIEAGTPLVHYIADVRNLERLPTSLAAAQTAFSGLRHPGLGWTISVGVSSPIMGYMFTLLSKLFRIRYKTVDTVEQALEFLKAQDHTLDWTNADQTLIRRDDPSPV